MAVSHWALASFNFTVTILQSGGLAVLQTCCCAGKRICDLFCQIGNKSLSRKAHTTKRTCRDTLCTLARAA